MRLSTREQRQHKGEFNLRHWRVIPEGINVPETGSILIWVILTLGIVLRLVQYLAGTSLWLDELAVTHNILGRSLWNLLLVPLSFDQVAPKGFLLAEKLSVSTLGANDYILRLFPLLCSVGALLVFSYAAQRVLDGVAAPVALALFAAAAPLITYSSQVKPYSTDVFVSVMLLWLVLNFHPDAGEVSASRAVWAGALGGFAVWFSFPAVLVVCGFAVTLAMIGFHVRREIGTRQFVLLRRTVVLWSISATVATTVNWLSLTPATSEYLHRFWAMGMLPSKPSWSFRVLWAWNRMKILRGAGESAALGYPFPVFYLTLAAFGFWLLWRRWRSISVFLLAPVCVTLVAAIFRQYPFSDRPILFLLPSFFLAIAASIERARQQVSLFSRLSGNLTVVALVIPALYPVAITPPIYRIEDIKPVLSYVQERRREDDRIYVYYGAGPAITYYGINYGLRENDYMIGGCHRGDAQRYFQELDMFRGRVRLWVVLTHALQWYRERDDILNYLDTIGLRRDSFAVKSHTISNWAGPAEVFLYDLSDPRRLSNAAATSFKLKGPYFPVLHFACEEGPQAMVAGRGR